MYLTSFYALFLLALVACQASPIEKKSISEVEMKLTKNEINLEDAGAEKDRSKKSATTFCVEVRSGKPEQVPCKQEVQQPTNVVYQPAQRQQTIHHIYPSAPAPAPAPAPTPIISIVPAPAPAPCDKPAAAQPPQPPQEIHHVIQEQKPVPRLRPQSIQPIRIVQIPQQEFGVLPVAPPSYKPNVVIAPTRPVGVTVPQSIYVEVPQAVYPQAIKTQKEAYECSCRPEHRVKSGISRIQDPRYMVYSSSAAVESAPYRSSMITAEYDPSNSPIVFASEGAKQVEERHHKKKTPLHPSGQVPLIYEPDNSPKYYEPSSRPATYQISYAYPSSYAYGTSYSSLINYDSHNLLVT